MAKFVVAFTFYFLAAALTSCSASRPLFTVTALSTGQTDSAIVTSKSGATVFSSESASTGTESGTLSGDQEGELTEIESGEVFHGSLYSAQLEEHCMEEGHLHESGPCHRILSADYGEKQPNPDPKGP